MERITWEHPYYTSFIDIPDECYGRQRLKLLLEMPACTLDIGAIFEGIRGNEIACYAPIFQLDARRPLTFLYLHGYMKRVFWQAYELVALGGIRDFYIVIQEELRILIEPYRQACGFPEARILEVPNVHKYPGYLKKIAMMPYIATQTGHAHYVSLDTSITLMQTVPFAKTFQTHWEDSPDDILFLADPWKIPDHYHNIESRTPYRSSMAAANADYFCKIPDFFGEKSYETFSHRMHAHPMWVPSPIWGMPRSYLDAGEFKAFLDFIVQSGCITHDEAFLCHYWHRYLAPNRRIWTTHGVPIFNINKFRDKKDNDAIFVHYSDAGKNDSRFAAEYIYHLNQRS